MEPDAGRRRRPARGRVEVPSRQAARSGDVHVAPRAHGRAPRRGQADHARGVRHGAAARRRSHVLRPLRHVAAQRIRGRGVEHAARVGTPSDPRRQGDTRHRR